MLLKTVQEMSEQERDEFCDSLYKSLCSGEVNSHSKDRIGRTVNFVMREFTGEFSIVPERLSVRLRYDWRDVLARFYAGKSYDEGRLWEIIEIENAAHASMLARWASKNR